MAQNLSPTPGNGIPPAEPAFYLVGPTGVGKSELAVRVAERIGGEIVGADAFQVYAGLPILTAQPPGDLLTRVPHHLVGEIPLSQSFNLAEYLRLAGERISAIRARGRIPVVVGGTGLYIRGLMYGLADLPESDEALRAELSHLPLEELQRRLLVLDPDSAAAVDFKNPRRVIRALEVCLLTGKPFSSFREEWKDRASTSTGVLLLRSRDELYQRINERVLQMFDEGVVEQVNTAGRLSQTAQQVLGFREIQQLLAARLSRSECIAAIQQETRRYAKRQLTWFRRETWLEAVDLSGQTDQAEMLIADLADRQRPPT